MNDQNQNKQISTDEQFEDKAAELDDDQLEDVAGGVEWDGGADWNGGFDWGGSDWNGDS